MRNKPKSLLGMLLENAKFPGCCILGLGDGKRPLLQDDVYLSILTASRFSIRAVSLVA